ncbi:MAG: nucleotidyltransferase domain-containing protein [Geminicoccaceae bacterium]
MSHDRSCKTDSADSSARPAVGRADAFQVLRAHERELRAKGVTGLAIFGSLARGNAGPDSDVDLVLELGEDATLGLFDLVATGNAGNRARQIGRPRLP